MPSKNSGERERARAGPSGWGARIARARVNPTKLADLRQIWIVRYWGQVKSSRRVPGAGK